MSALIQEQLVREVPGAGVRVAQQGSWVCVLLLCAFPSMRKKILAPNSYCIY